MNDNHCTLCEKDITEEKEKHELNKMENNKSHGNDSLKKTKKTQLYEAFWGQCLSFYHLKWFSKKGIKYFSKTSCNKTYHEKGPPKKVYKKLETYIFT